MGQLADAVRSDLLGPFSSGDKALAAIFGSPPTAAGVPVTEETADTLSAFWCGVNCISGSVAALPLHFYKRLDNDDKEKFLTHPNYRLVHNRPNDEMSTFSFREMLTRHALTWGNGYA